MNYNRNQKISQIDENTLIVGVDIAKKTNYARAQDFRGIDFSKALKFDNEFEGFEALCQWIHDLQLQHSKSKLIVGMEPTGHYWLNLAYYLKTKGILVVTVNPMHVNRSKEFDDNSPSKNDTKDAKVIAQLIKDGRYSFPSLPEGIYAELRQGIKVHESLTQNLNAVKAKVHNWLDRYFPEFLSVFKDWEGKAALQVLKMNCLPHELLSMSDEAILLEVKKGASRAVGLRRIQQLKQAADQSVGIQSGARMAKHELHVLLTQYELYINELEVLEEELKAMIIEVPGAKQMIAIKGIGTMTVVGFFAEVGDLSKYNHPRQLIKLAGLNLRRNESGKHKGQTKISKRGRRRLRALLFRVAMPLSAKNNAFKQLHDYYRHRPNNPLTGKQSLIALCGKLLKILFVIGKRQTEFDELRMIQDLPQINDLQNVA